MTHPIIVGVLLGLAILIMAITCIGLFRFRSPYVKVHMVGPSAMLCPALIVLAVVVESSQVSSALKAILVAVLITVPSPVTAHFLARVTRKKREGGLSIKPEETEGKQ